ncbi:XTP/dITP diphosphatase [Fructilactobacillus florum]|uniref:dITP/XTP pyrophosphatase n=1 Tax=Fructilactobacillus florum DSM 22689 = JCM 16035 TaxID=1423745 RepID=A0A0R2CX70_9LACO|nr:XTP/dITP diphosphatase [Fructilactobacillus florum]KRM92406.1 nucleoside-triphosphatase [Fructilactobacillus florum DSM 22689 = JCM 16035]
MTNKVIVIASQNANKIREFQEMLVPKGYEVHGAGDFEDLAPVVETGQSFAENAQIKAQAVSQQLQQPVIADDSGLVVPAINGEPGIYSARYAGDHDDVANNAKLLKKLAHADDRNAYFHTTLVVMKPTGESLAVSGTLAGEILTEPRGQNGFGYDPLFFVPAKQKTLAEMSAAEKNEISHRAQALRKLATKLDQWW